MAFTAMDDEKPPVRRLVLKQREVIPVDTVARAGDGTAMSVPLIHQMNKIAAAKHEPLAEASPAPVGPELSPRFKLPEITPLDPPSPPGDEDAITVAGMLNRNHVAAVDTGPELIAMPKPRKSKRHRDFILILGLAGISVGSLAAVFRHDRQVMALALFGIVFLTVILAWIMYGVMDRY
ncbi:MAG TPA: hypothetical protein VII09_04980 [Opitutaceae bacterium]